MKFGNLEMWAEQRQLNKGIKMENSGLVQEMKNDLSETEEGHGNDFGKVDHSCQLLEEYKCQILRFN